MCCFAGSVSGSVMRRECIDDSNSTASEKYQLKSEGHPQIIFEN